MPKPGERVVVEGSKVGGGRREGTLVETVGSLIEDHPEVFFGTYRDEAGVVVVVFNPGVDPVTWEDRLTEEQIWQVIMYLYAATGQQPRRWESH